MREKIIQVIVTVVLGILFSSGVAIVEDSSSKKSIAINSNNRHIQAVNESNIDPPFPPPPPPPGGDRR